ncbi:MAG: S46 family peptidase [Labilithrix sp.]|nr:S46 family peptidase [Labilithrix sp.]MCW5835599.1 S46 family peptidase [Labilithrix sp.]
MRLGPRRLAPLFLLAVPSLLACGGDPAPARAPAAEGAAPSARAPGGPAEAPPRFENPGGMWMPHQVKDHAAKLKELGLAIDPAELADPTSGVLSAVVSLGGCSASFISPEGLIATNHHCATGALQHNSTPTANLLKDGYLAKTRADEKNNGPQARVFVTRAVTDVTAKMTDGLAEITDDLARYEEIEKRQKDLVAACERGASAPAAGGKAGQGGRSSGTRCSASPFYEGAQWFLVEQLEIRDVRLVWAPPAGVGNFGGEIDNWRWPRHTGDVSFFRAYVGKDGAPADYSPDNVPYKPPHHLKVASSPLRAGDLVFVAGYPGRTHTLKTKAEVDEAVSWAYPRRQKLYEEYLARLAEVTKDDKEAQIRATSYVRRFGNVLTNTKGQLDGLVKGGLAADKERSEQALRAFVAAEPDRKAKWLAPLDAIAAEIAARAAHRETDAELEEIAMPRLVGAALTIVRMAEERAKPDAARDPDFQERNWSRIEQGLRGLSTNYHRRVDDAVLGLALERAARAPAAERTPALGYVLHGPPTPEQLEKREQALQDARKAGVIALARSPSPPPTADEIAKAVAALYRTTKLGDEKARVELLKKGTTASLRQSKDPLVKLALALRPLQRAIEEREERFAGKMALLKPKYVEALRAFREGPFAPDANSTLRITYGTVRGYRPAPGAPAYQPFTVLPEVVAKHKGQEPFDVPAEVLEAVEAKKGGPYVDEKLGEVPVDFLADLHITGGNSGSATLDAKGELVGLAFDGNYEAMASDWVFTPSITRSIHVDMRYVLWLLDGPLGGDHLLQEMGVAPKL